MVDICPRGWLQRDTNVFVNMKEVVGVEMKIVDFRRFGFHGSQQTEKR